MGCKLGDWCHLNAVEGSIFRPLWDFIFLKHNSRPNPQAISSPKSSSGPVGLSPEPVSFKPRNLFWSPGVPDRGYTTEASPLDYPSGIWDASHLRGTMLKESITFLGPCPHKDRDYHIGSNFWKFYLIRTSFTLGEPVSLVKVFRLFRSEQIFFDIQSVDTVGRCTTS
jgi:hypothetical protein